MGLVGNRILSKMASLAVRGLRPYFALHRETHYPASTARHADEVIE
jgi:hypothetical protein